jgi:hypothetical protein
MKSIEPMAMAEQKPSRGSVPKTINKAVKQTKERQI